MSDHLIPIINCCKWCGTRLDNNRVYCSRECRLARRAYERRQERAEKRTRDQLGE